MPPILTSIITAVVLGGAPFSDSGSSAEATQSLTPTQWSEEIDALIEELERRHPGPYHAVSREAFLDRADRLRQAATKASAHEMTLGLASLMASLEETHSYLYFWSATDEQKVEFGDYGIRMAPFSDGFFITSTAPARSELAGSRVVLIGGQPTESVFARLRAAVYSGDNPYTQFHVNPRFLSMPEVLAHLGVAEPDRAARLLVEDSDGATRVEVLLPLPAEAAAPYDPRPKEQLQRSLFWRDPDTFYWATVVPEHDAVYVQLNAVKEREDLPLARFADELAALIEKNRPARIVLDLRRNNGGNSRLARPLIRTLVSHDVTRRPGGLVALIAEPVLSAAVVFLAELEKYVPVTYIGRPTGSDRAQWGDNAFVPLPNSRIPVSYATAFYEVGGPYPPRGPILPHVLLEPTGAQFLAVEDPVLEAAFDYAPAGGVEDVYEAALKDGRNPITAVAAFVEDDRHALRDFERPLRLLAERAGEEIDLRARAALTELLVAHHPDRARSYMAHAGSLEALGERQSAVEMWHQGRDTIPEDTSLYRALKQRLSLIAGSEIERLQSEPE